MLKLISKDQECESALKTEKIQILTKHSPIGSKSLNGEPFSTLLERWISEGAEKTLRKNMRFKKEEGSRVVGVIE